MNDIIEDVLDIEASSGPTNEQRETIVDLCRQQVRQERVVAKLEAELHIAKDTLRMIREVKLPGAMLEAGVTREDLTNGASVVLRIDYHTNQLTSEEGFKYLISQKAGSLIKHDINMQFGREQATLVRQILNRIAKWKSASNFKLTEKRAVNAQTLRGWVNEQIRNGVDLPFDILGIYARKYTVVNVPENNKLG